MSEAETPIAGPPAGKVYERCHQCSSPVDDGQRYCVVCGARNKRAADPVAGYLSVATSRSRAAKASRPPSARPRRASGLGTAAVIAVIPLAVALGVVLGRSNAGGEGKLIAALRAQKPPVITVTGGAGSASSVAAAGRTTSVASTFTLAKGYTVELGTLPARRTSSAAITQAEQAAKARGATAVGVIDVKQFSLRPKPPGAVYVVYSGQYRDRSGANTALAKLKGRFPAALVISVRPTAAPSAKSGGQVNATATRSQLAQGTQEVKKMSHATGSGYVQAQNSLPGEVSVP